MAKGSKSVASLFTGMPTLNQDKINRTKDTEPVLNTSAEKEVSTESKAENTPTPEPAPVEKKQAASEATKKTATKTTGYVKKDSDKKNTAQGRVRRDEKEDNRFKVDDIQDRRFSLTMPTSTYDWLSTEAYKMSSPQKRISVNQLILLAIAEYRERHK